MFHFTKGNRGDRCYKVCYFDFRWRCHKIKNLIKVNKHTNAS